MFSKIFKPEKVSQFWVVCIVLIYGLIISEYYSTLNSRVLEIQDYELRTSSFYTVIMSFSFFTMLIAVFVVWQIFSFMFHLCAILLGGMSSYRNFQKYTGICYFIPALGFLIVYILSERIDLPKDYISEFLISNKYFIIINWIINICFLLYYILLVPLIKYLYQINWVKAIGAIAIPIGSIYLLGQFFSKFVL